MLKNNIFKLVVILIYQLYLMDTRFWGPDGWKLLHSIVENYPDYPSINEKKIYSIFFNSIKHVLPCIYCRRSLNDYMNELPIEKYINSKINLCYWLYLIHNKVNDKLKKQGLNNNPNPEFKQIKDRYKNYLIEVNNNNCIGMPGWDFLYTIIFNYPIEYKQIESIRQYNYIIFFRYLGKVLPFKSVKDNFTLIIQHTNFKYILLSRDKFKLWFYNLEKKIKQIINCKCINYRDRCDFIERYRAGCNGKNDTKPTCRTKKYIIT